MGSAKSAGWIAPITVQPYSRAKYGNESWYVSSLRFSGGTLAVTSRTAPSSRSIRSVNPFTFRA